MAQTFINTGNFLGGLGGMAAIYNPAAYGRPDPTTTSTTTGTDYPRQIAANLPNYQQMVQESSENILGNLQGQLSPDVTRNIQQMAAERGIATGSPGSPNMNAAMLRALGLTTLDLQNLAENQLTQAIRRTPVQETQTGTQQTVGGPDPYAAAMANLAAAQMGLGAGGGVRVGGGGGGAPEQPQFPLPWGRTQAVMSATPGGEPTVYSPGGGVSAWQLPTGDTGQWSAGMEMMPENPNALVDPLSGRYYDATTGEEFTDRDSFPALEEPFMEEPSWYAGEFEPTDVGGEGLPTGEAGLTDEEWNALLYGEE